MTTPCWVKFNYNTRYAKSDRNQGSHLIAMRNREGNAIRKGSCIKLTSCEGTCEFCCIIPMAMDGCQSHSPISAEVGVTFVIEPVDLAWLIDPEQSNPSYYATMLQAFEAVAKLCANGPITCTNIRNNGQSTCAWLCNYSFGTYPPAEPMYGSGIREYWSAAVSFVVGVGEYDNRPGSPGVYTHGFDIYNFMIHGHYEAWFQDAGHPNDPFYYWKDADVSLHALEGHTPDVGDCPTAGSYSALMDLIWVPGGQHVSTHGQDYPLGMNPNAYVIGSVMSGYINRRTARLCPIQTVASVNVHYATESPSWLPTKSTIALDAATLQCHPDNWLKPIIDKAIESANAIGIHECPRHPYEGYHTDLHPILDCPNWFYYFGVGYSGVINEDFGCPPDGSQCCADWSAAFAIYYVQE